MLLIGPKLGNSCVTAAGFSGIGLKMSCQLEEKG